MRVDIQHDDSGTDRSLCLTELSLSALLGGAVGASALLWLAILWVL